MFRNLFKLQSIYFYWYDIVALVHNPNIDIYLCYGVRSLGNMKTIPNGLSPYSIILTMHALYSSFWRLVSLFVRDLLHTGVSQETRKKTHMYWTLHGGSMCNPSWLFHNFIPIRQPKCPSGDKANFQLDLIEKKDITDQRGQQRFSPHYGQIEDTVWFCLLSYSSHAWKPGQNVICGFVCFDIPIHYLSIYMVEW